MRKSNRTGVANVPGNPTADIFAEADRAIAACLKILAGQLGRSGGFVSGWRGEADIASHCETLVKAHHAVHAARCMNGEPTGTRTRPGDYTKADEG